MWRYRSSHIFDSCHFRFFANNFGSLCMPNSRIVGFWGCIWSFTNKTRSTTKQFTHMEIFSDFLCKRGYCHLNLTFLWLPSSSDELDDSSALDGMVSKSSLSMDGWRHWTQPESEQNQKIYQYYTHGSESNKPTSANTTARLTMVGWPTKREMCVWVSLVNNYNSYNAERASDERYDKVKLT